ncbi:hypothetical protein FQZ97_1078430 [compost metagenome]
MLRIDADRRGGELLLQALRGDGIAEEQAGRVFIVDEVAARIGAGLLAPLGHRDAVVAGVLDHADAVGAQLVLLPLAGIGGHVHRGLKTQACADDANRQAEIAGRADGDLVAAEEGPGRVAVEHAVIVGWLQQACGQRQLLGMFEHFIDAATRLDRTGDGQVAVLLEPQHAAVVQPVAFG